MTLRWLEPRRDARGGYTAHVDSAQRAGRPECALPHDRPSRKAAHGKFFTGGMRFPCQRPAVQCGDGGDSIWAFEEG